MGTDYYPAKDLWYRPFVIGGANNEIVINEEDPQGNTATISTTIRQSSSSELDGPYYPTASDDPIDGSGGVTTPATHRRILNGTNDTLTVTHFYDELVQQLTAESGQNGRGFTYQAESATPSGSDQTNSGITLSVQTTGASIEIVWDTNIVGSPIPPVVLGFDRDRAGPNASPSTQAKEVTGPYSRGISWYSPVRAHEKSRIDQYDTFRSSANARHANTWRFTDQRRVRTLQYVQVAGVHVWAHDRAGRSSQSDLGGVPGGDNNNALIDFWDGAMHADRDIIIAHHRGPAPGKCQLDAGMTTGHALSVGRLTGPLEERFAPHEDTDRSPTKHPDEQYDLSIELAEASPDAFDSATATPYRH